MGIDGEIGSPLVKNPPAVIALNLPSFDKYESMIQPGGVLIVNQSMVDRTAQRSSNQSFVGSGWLVAEKQPILA